jgi:tetratricopeptide (TPR) repeat protein
MKKIVYAVAFAAAILPATAALADDVMQNADTCTNGKVNDVAIAACKAALSQMSSSDSRYAGLYLTMATRTTGAHRYADAIDAFTKIIELTPHSYLGYSGRGTVYTLEKNYPLATEDLNKAVQLAPDDPLTRVNRSSLEIQLGEFDQAIADADHALGIAQGQSAVLLATCEARAVGNVELSTALHDCNQALELAPHSAPILEARGFVYFRNGDYADAIKDENDSVAVDAKKPGALYVRGLAKAKSGDIAGGKADKTAALAIDADIAKTFASYGVTP